jgi:hypothetical protein
MMGKILATAEPNVCAAILYGTVTPDEFMHALHRAGNEATNTFHVLQADAALAEIRQDPPPRYVNLEDGPAALIAVFQRMPDAHVKTLIGIDDGETGYSDEQVCAAGRALYDGVMVIDEPFRSTLARSLVQAE